MPEFLKLLPPDAARKLLLENMARLEAPGEEVNTATALHRIVARAVVAPHALPEFARSTVDGYALVARDTFGASGSQPAYLAAVGEVAMGAAPSLQVVSGTCALIHTGGMLPDGADAVVMLENTQRIGAAGIGRQSEPEIEVLKTTAPGENCIAVGEDVTAGQTVLEAGREIRSQEIGGLMALGIVTVRVKKKPQVAIISTGDELVEPHLSPQPGQVRDVNGSCLAAMVADVGGDPIQFGIIPDHPAQLAEVARKALQLCDMVVITAGSSASARDLTAATIRSLGMPGVLVHGINIRPGKPTILAVCEGKPVLGLPGNPVSAFVVARLFVLPAIAHLLGQRLVGAPATIPARLAVNLASQAGREDWWPVKLQGDPTDSQGRVAVPVFGRSNLIFNLVSADGLIRVPSDLNGLEAGDPVQVEPF